MHVEIRRRLARVISLLPSREFGGSNSANNLGRSVFTYLLWSRKDIVFSRVFTDKVSMVHVSKLFVHFKKKQKYTKALGELFGKRKKVTGSRRQQSMS